MQVRRRSAAERAGVKVGDLVLAINDTSTGTLSHQQMLAIVGQHQQLTLTLTLARYAAYTPPCMLPILGAATPWDASLPTLEIMIKGKGSPYSIIYRGRVPELIPVLGCQPAGDVSHKPGGRLPLLSVRQACSYPRNP